VKERRRKSLLSDEDRDLWARVASSVAPLADARGADSQDNAVVPQTPNPVSVSPGPPPPQPPIARPAKSKPERLPPAKSPAAPAGRSRVPPPLATELHRREQRRIASGRTEIDARIDLHGMTQSEAHAVLRSFLHGCAARGDRLVLVITGKGGDRPVRDEHFDLYADRRDRGVLRRNVPSWLSEPDLRPLVIGYTSASSRHGGDGALYVTVRSRARRSDDVDR